MRDVNHTLLYFCRREALALNMQQESINNDESDLYVSLTVQGMMIFRQQA